MDAINILNATQPQQPQEATANAADSRLQTLVDLGLVSGDVAAEIDRQQQSGAVRLGAALTLDDLYQLAQITQAEIARAAGEWQAETNGDASDWLTAAGGAALLALLLRDRGRGEVLDEIERNILRHQEHAQRYAGHDRPAHRPGRLATLDGN